MDHFRRAGRMVAVSTEELAVQEGVATAGRMPRTGGRLLSRRSEAALVPAAQRGSAEAAEELFWRHWPSAHRAAWLVVHDAAAADVIAPQASLARRRALSRFERRRPL